MSEKKKERRRIGDRFDGKVIKDLDGMHIFMPVLYPNRCDNEAFISELIDMAPIDAYIQKKNQEEGNLFPYTPFHVIVTALIKTLTLRPKLNRFAANGIMYQRNWISVAFVVKKLFSDDGEEALAIIYADPGDTADTIHEKLYDQISTSRSNTIDPSMNSMNIVGKLPVRFVRAIARLVCFLEKRGKCPRYFIASDPYYSTCLVSNIGSLHLESGYHHLTNWGTCSLFLMVGEIGDQVVVGSGGEPEVKRMLPITLTIDERIADGYYYSKSIRLIKKLLENPELLEHPMNEEIEY